MVEKAVVAQPMHTRLLWRRLWWRCQEIRYLLDTFREVQLRLFAQAFTVGVGSVEEIRVDIKEGVVVLVLGCD